MWAVFASVQQALTKLTAITTTLTTMTSTALSTATWTPARAAKLDGIGGSVIKNVSHYYEVIQASQYGISWTIPAVDLSKAVINLCGVSPLDTGTTLDNSLFDAYFVGTTSLEMVRKSNGSSISVHVQIIEYN